MCIEDIAISRKCYKVITQCPAGTVIRLAANPSRLSVRIGGRITVNTLAVISDSSANAALFLGYITGEIRVGASSDKIAVFDMKLDYRTDGPIVQEELFVLLGTNAGYVVETIMMNELAAAVGKHLDKLIGG